MSTNILDVDAYGTELRGSCGDGKEVRCHGPRMRPSTARGKIISFILGKPFYCRIVPAVRSVILAGCPPVFEQVQAVTVMRVWVSEAFPALSTAVYPSTGINDILPRVIFVIV